MKTKSVVAQLTITDHARGRVANVQVDKDFFKFARDAGKKNRLKKKFTV